MSALEWLDAVRADLDAADLPWAETWSEYGSTVHTTDGYTVAWVGKAEDAELIASAPDRLDRMERALRGAMAMHEPEPEEVQTADGFDWIVFCRECRLEWGDDGCPTVTTIQEVLR